MTTLSRLTPIPDEELWRAVQVRDSKYDEEFVFGVLSTRIYCRPSCPSKRAHRENVVFFPEPRAAERAGFRACLRCKPEVRTVPHWKRAVEEACSFIDRNPDGKITLRILGHHVGYSPFHLQRIFKKAVGITPRQYAEKSKLDRAKLLLKRGESVRRSTYGSGHNSMSWLYSNPDAMLGMHPAAYKDGGAGMLITYCITNCQLGRLLVAGTEKGICAVSLGDSDSNLESSLRNEYPRAELGKDASRLRNWVERIVEHVGGNEVTHLSDLPLDVRATSFQYRVWKVLQSIPYGSTLSYGEVSRRVVGSPRSSRAVANACAANPAALVIPCHRVIRKNGRLGGYRWGIERKRALLKKEAEVASSSSD